MEVVGIARQLSADLERASANLFCQLCHGKTGGMPNCMMPGCCLLPYDDISGQSEKHSKDNLTATRTIKDLFQLNAQDHISTTTGGVTTSPASLVLSARVLPLVGRQTELPACPCAPMSTHEPGPRWPRPGVRVLSHISLFDGPLSMRAPSLGRLLQMLQ